MTIGSAKKQIFWMLGKNSRARSKCGGLGARLIFAKTGEFQVFSLE